eukprot:289075-Chlamydomonas_euryale.AAC.1
MHPPTSRAPHPPRPGPPPSQPSQPSPRPSPPNARAHAHHLHELGEANVLLEPEDVLRRQLVVVDQVKVHARLANVRCHVSVRRQLERAVEVRLLLHALPRLLLLLLLLQPLQQVRRDVLLGRGRHDLVPVGHAHVHQHVGVGGACVAQRGRAHRAVLVHAAGAKLRVPHAGIRNTHRQQRAHPVRNRA